MAETVDRLKVASDDDPAERDDPAGEDVTSDLGLDDAEAAPSPKDEDPRELRFQIRRLKRKLKEADVQAGRLQKMAAHEAIERTRLTLAHKESNEKVERGERELLELKREHKDVVRDVERWREATQQAKAQVESQRERRKKERDEAQQFGLGTVIMELLPVFDHLELAITHAESDPEHILEGVQMVMDQLGQTLERLGIERVEARRGQPFLPERHEAVLYVFNQDLPHGTIAELLRPGFLVKKGGRLLRAARVSVASHEPSSVETSETPAASTEPEAAAEAVAPPAPEAAAATTEENPSQPTEDPKPEGEGEPSA